MQGHERHGSEDHHANDQQKDLVRGGLGLLHG
jgi:hypothetical protein